MSGSDDTVGWEDVSENLQKSCNGRCPRPVAFFPSHFVQNFASIDCIGAYLFFFLSLNSAKIRLQILSHYCAIL